MRERVLLIVVMHCSVLSLASCSGVPTNPAVQPKSVFEKCGDPPITSFTQTIFDGDVGLTVTEVAKGGVRVSTKPEVIQLLSQAANDEHLRSYLRCVAMNRDGFSIEQAFYLEEMYLFASTKPKPAEFESWHEKHPFPSKGDIAGGAEDHSKKEPGAGPEVTTSPPIDTVNQYISSQKPPLSEGAIFELFKRLFTTVEYKDTRETLPEEMLFILCRTEVLLRQYVTELRTSVELRDALLNATMKIIKLRDQIGQQLYGSHFDGIAQCRENGKSTLSGFRTALPSRIRQPGPKDYVSWNTTLKELRKHLAGVGLVPPEDESILSDCDAISGRYELIKERRVHSLPADICPMQDQGTLTLSCDTDQRLKVFETTYNKIFLTNRSGSKSQKQACGESNNDIELCRYDAEWEFNGTVDIGGRSATVEGRLSKPRIGLDDCGKNIQLTKAQGRELAEQKKAIVDNFTMATCDFRFVFDGNRFAGLSHRDCSFNNSTARFGDDWRKR